VLDLVSCECQRCCTRERGGQTTEQAGEKGRDGGGDNAISRVRYGIAGGFERLSRNEHKVSTVISSDARYLASYRYLENWAFQISSQFFPPSRFSRLHFDCTSWPAPRPPSYFSHYFSGSPPPSPLLLLFLPPVAIPLFFFVLVRSKRFYTRAKSRLSYLASLLGEDLSCGTLAASRRGCQST